MNFVDIPNLPKIIDKGRTYYNPNIANMERYQYIKKEIRNKYHIQLPSRDSIIKQLISTITHGDIQSCNVPKIDLLIIRSDIKNFFPSINKHQLYQKIQRGSLLKPETIEILKPLFFSKKAKGVPLGLPFSSVLAELYLENFDYDIWNTFQPMFYFRYVDDIILITYDKIQGINPKKEKSKLFDISKKYSLAMNNDKTEIIEYTPKGTTKRVQFSYLGYQFDISYNKLSLSIKNEKLYKIEQNIRKNFYIYKSNLHDENVEFWKLYYRIKNILYGVTSKDKNGQKMKFGLGYTYRFITDPTSLQKIYKLVKSLIYSCKLSYRKKHIMLSIIDGCDENPMMLLTKRYDYTSLSTNQKKKIAARLKINKKSPDITNIFYKIYSK
ncbi:RNA-directed DNA polymerase [Tetragenococcus halophilus]|uniref:RNA-directed DNA polymerase n=1 Tax=Tetragenococcus halophilus TaxID=51669 RepID=UPI00209B1F58|nr:RNA-directed DNA polymerase [Tetragenococcus halophilus]MCO8292542.1 RNA-directed DNA polymerase [Tetragenococcus halophilus]GMG69187.1 hypothetical protein TEHMS4_21240 [Tetragenococcus halophilus]